MTSPPPLPFPSCHHLSVAGRFRRGKDLSQTDQRLVSPPQLFCFPPSLTSPTRTLPTSQYQLAGEHEPDFQWPMGSPPSFSSFFFSFLPLDRLAMNEGHFSSPFPSPSPSFFPPLFLTFPFDLTAKRKGFQPLNVFPSFPLPFFPFLMVGNLAAIIIFCGGSVCGLFLRFVPSFFSFHFHLFFFSFGRGFVVAGTRRPWLSDFFFY